MLRRLLLMLIVGVGCVVTVRAQTIEDFEYRLSKRRRHVQLLPAL